MAEQLARRIGRYLPYLRRYARAVTGSQATGDAAVRGALERLLGGEGAATGEDVLRLALYRALDDVLRASVPPPGADDGRGGTGEGGAAPDGLLADGGILASSVGQLAPPKRRILLLTALEASRPTRRRR
jgi:DNA-directed RNA polymerase specialized sigma24 family protein